MRFLFSSSKSIGRPVYIVAAKRTAIGAFNGRLSSFTAPELGGFAIRGAIDSINLSPKEVDEVILGNVLGAGLGQAPARQASIKGGLGVEVPCTTVNKVCSSGLKTLVYGAQSIALNQSDVVVAGGFESMSRAPHILLNVIMAQLRRGRAWAMETKSCLMSSPTTVSLTLSTRLAWDSAPKKLPLISRSPARLRTSTARDRTASTSKQ